MESQEPIRVVNLSESDVQRVAAEVTRQTESRPEQVGETTPEVVRAALTAVLPPVIPVVAPVSTTPDTNVVTQRVEVLVHMAELQGIDAAHAQAAQEEPYILDAFHDALSGALYDQLKQAGKL